MDIHTAGLTHLASSLAPSPAPYRASEDAYYAAHQGWTLPPWLIRFAAALTAPRPQAPAHPASIRHAKLA